MTHGVFDVRDFGANGDNSSDNTAAFAAALDAAEALSNGSRPYGGVVQVPPGEYFVDQIRMRSQCALIGFGPSTVIRKLPGIASPLVVLDRDDTNFTVLRDLRLRGNKYGGGGGGTAHGIDYQNSEDSAEIRAAELYAFHGDPQHRISGVTVDAVDGIGMRLFTREAQVQGCLIADTTGDGLVLDGSDNWVSSTSINWIGRRGVVVQGGNNRLTAVKAWYIGTDPSYSEADAFLLRANRQTLTGCEAQDVSRYGLYLFGADNCVVSSMMLDNIGNFFKTQNQGFDQPALEGGLALTRYTEVDLCAYNNVHAVFAQRSSQSNLNSLLAFGTGTRNCFANISGNPDHILTPRTVARANSTTTYDNFATVNGRVA